MTTTISPIHLWKYKEFNRIMEPAPNIMGYFHNHSVEAVAEYIKINGMEPIELSIIDNSLALVTDGNHRLGASILNGEKLVPVHVNHFTKEEAELVFYPQTLNRFKPLV